MTYKPLHELSREEFFNDIDHVRSTMPNKHRINFKYPIGGGQFGKHHFISEIPHKKGDAVNYGVVRGATVTSSKEFKPPYNNLEMFEHGKKHHREAVEKAHAEGKTIPSHVLADYPHLSSQHSEEESQEESTLSTMLHGAPGGFAPAILTKPIKEQTTQYAEGVHKQFYGPGLGRAQQKTLQGRSNFLAQRGKRFRERLHKILLQHGGAVYDAHGGFTLPKRASESFNQAASDAGFHNGHHYTLG